MTNGPITDEMVGWAQAAQRVYQIPSSLNLAAAGVESSFGKATPPGSNNWHGMKALPGEAQVSTSTGEQAASGAMYTIVAGFKAFSSPAGSFLEYGRLLGLGSPYHKMVTAFLNSPRAIGDVKTLANALQGVYATSHTYGAALCAMIDQYNLGQYDALPGAAPAPLHPIPAPPAPAPAAPALSAAATKAVLVFLASARSLSDITALLQSLTQEPPLTTPATALSTPATPAAAVAAAATVAAQPRVTPSVGMPIRVDWGSLAAQLIDHEKPIIEALAEAGITAAEGMAGPIGPILQMFIGPQMVKQYLDQGLVALEGQLNPQVLTVDQSNMLLSTAANLFNANEPALAGFLGSTIEPLFQKGLAALGFPTA